jgi:hypothetical protein
LRDFNRLFRLIDQGLLQRYLWIMAAGFAQRSYEPGSPTQLIFPAHYGALNRWLASAEKRGWNRWGMPV